MTSTVFRLSVVLALLFGTLASAADGEAPWLDARKLDEAALLSTLDADSEATADARAIAGLTLAERALNQSVRDAERYLSDAEHWVMPGTHVADVAAALRCQLDHRQGLPAAQTSCPPVIDRQGPAGNRFVDAMELATRMYFYYREGRHDLALASADSLVREASYVGDDGLLAAAHNMLGLHFSTKLLPRLSLPHFETALAHARALPYPEYMVIVYLNLASSYTYLGRAGEARQMLEEAVKSPVVDLYPTRRLVVQSMIAQAQAAHGSTEGAAAGLRRVMDEVADDVLPDAMTFGHTGLGVVLLAENRPREALAEFDEVLRITGQNFETGLAHPRVQLMVAAYGSALREAGELERSRALLESVIAAAPADEPDQLLVDACKSLALTLEALGDAEAARDATEMAARLESQLWDASFQYQVARLNASLDSDRQRFELERAQERETALRETAERETRLRQQTWLLGAMIVALVLLYFSRRLQKHKADSERAASARLEDQVVARTRQLEDEMALRMEAEVERRRLIEKMSEGEKMRALGQLTAGVAHDFNNLMTVVTLGADQLRARLVREEDSSSADVLNHIVEAADTGARITRGLLAYVRKQPLQPEVVALDAFFEKASPIFRNTLGEPIELRLSLEPCQALVDKGQLTTSMLNLLLNAREAMPNGGRVTLSVRAIDERVDIEVRDTGVGMSARIRQRAVDPFFTTKEAGDGTGLGLSMVYGFARQSGGDLSIESVAGEGATVTLSLPLASPLDIGGEDDAPLQSPVARHTRVLAVEDRAMLLHILKPTLEQLGMDVFVASNAQQAIERVDAEGLPDVLISDIVMPGDKDGIDLVNALREQRADLPVVLMSGCSASVDIDCEFLRKPFSVDDLSQAIQRALCAGGTVDLPHD